ncbi:MAG TPA: Clp protease N-terminal domain-containing protein [Ktedonobacterales bacterium]|nr:Clp protease N-terminal domain-containing protein [Ktedonobacterales bacterium]
MVIDFESLRDEEDWPEQQVATTPWQEQIDRLTPLLSERGMWVVTQARNEARRFDHLAVSTEHLLLALLRESDNGGALVLRRLGVDLLRLHDVLGGRLGPVGQRIRVGVSGMTAVTMKAIHLGQEEAQRLGHDTADPEHILLGLWRIGDSNAGRILARLPVTLEQARLEVMRLNENGNSVAPTAANATAQAANTLGVIDVASRVSVRDRAALDALVESGVHATREEAAAWLIHAGIVANAELFERVNDLIAQIRQLREAAQSLAHEAESTGEAPSAPDEPNPSA